MLNLAVKLYLTNPTQTELLCQYIFNLARYDQNYDIRDRARFLKQFVFPSSGQSTILSRNAKKIFLAAKPAPLLESKYQGREQYQLGSLSHYLNMKANGYNDIPSFPEVAPDSSVRNVESPNETPSTDEPVRMTAKQSKAAAKGKSRSFYSESEKSSSEYSSDSDDSGSESDDASAEENGAIDKKSSGAGVGKKSSSDETEDSDSDSSDSDDTSTSDSDSDDASSSGDDHRKAKNVKMTNHQPTKPVGNGEKLDKSNLDLLLDLGDISPAGPVMTPSLGGFLTPMTQNISSISSNVSNRIELVGPIHIPLNSGELINKVNGYGLGVTYRFTRAPHLFLATMVSIELLLTNYSNDVMENIKIGDKTLSPGMQLNEFATIAVLPSKATAQGTLGIDFNDSTQPVSFDIVTKTSTCHATIKTTVGEFIRAILMSEIVYREERSKLRGMNEHSISLPLSSTLSDSRSLQQRIYEHANVASVPSSIANVLNFAGQTLSSQSLVLLTVELTDGNAVVTVNCEKMVVGSMLLNEIKVALRN